jgi:hypothetical protein
LQYLSWLSTYSQDRHKFDSSFVFHKVQNTSNTHIAEHITGLADSWVQKGTLANEGGRCWTQRTRPFPISRRKDDKVTAKARKNQLSPRRPYGLLRAVSGTTSSRRVRRRRRRRQQQLLIPSLIVVVVAWTRVRIHLCHGMFMRMDCTASLTHKRFCIPQTLLFLIVACFLKQKKGKIKKKLRKKIKNRIIRERKHEYWLFLEW